MPLGYMFIFMNATCYHLFYTFPSAFISLLTAVLLTANQELHTNVHVRSGKEVQ